MKLYFFLVFSFFSLLNLSAQKMLDIAGNPTSTDTVAKIQVNHTGEADIVGLFVQSTPFNYRGIGGIFEGGEIGLQSSCELGFGIYSTSRIGNAMYGYCDLNTAVVGYSNQGTGVYGYSGDSIGVHGFSVNEYGIYGESENSYAGYFNGDVFTTGSYLPSAGILKKNDKPIKNALALIEQLRPVSYQYKTKAYKNFNLPENLRYGLIAEEVATILPQLVKDTKLSISPSKKADEPTASKRNRIARSQKQTSIKAVNYTELIPILLSGIQEQQALIANLESEVLELKSLIAQYRERKTENKEKTSLLPTSTDATISQNQPNPFSQHTVITYFVPREVNNVVLRITNISGQTLEEIQLSQKGDGQIQIEAYNYPKGAYFYSLVIDGKTVETHKMLHLDE